MKRIHFLLFSMSFLAACAPATDYLSPLASPIPTITPAIAAVVAPSATLTPSPTPVPPTPTPSPTPSFTPATYRDEMAGFELDYPQDWFVSAVPDDLKAQSGAYSAVFVSQQPQENGHGGLPPGVTKIDVTVIKDGDLTPEQAIARRRQEILNSEPPATIKDERKLVLPGGLPTARFELEGMAPVVEYVTAIGGDMILVTGYGDFDLVDEVAGTLRPLENAAP